MIQAGRLISILFLILPLACTATVSRNIESDPAQVAPTTSPFAYCAEKGTVDEPGSAWQKPEVTAEIVAALKRAEVITADAPVPPENACRWRCMDQQVYACCTGANLPCDQKGDSSRTPSKAMNTYCAQNPKADVIPAYVTGRATVFTWTCSGKTAVPGRQVLHLDARGYPTEFWHRVTAE
ncbi:hypothetical protein [Oligoflexus tunisiensis]|uniref:hypothetical protein n=1 Tax=Oligoflexus tunisiensis TaxID=708132 RepID=UPI00114CDC9A|nr:hypothetical protein [Oligoflexus tunisiensis]